MDHERLTHLVADREDGIQARHRLLEDHREVVAAQLTHLFGLEFEQVAAVETDHPRLDVSCGFRHERHDGERSHRLPAARLTHDRQGPASDHLETHPVNGARDA